VKVLYVAGRYRGPNAWVIEQNIRDAEHLALQVWAAGFVALCPHTMTRFYQGALPDAVWLAGDLELLRRCDGILMVPGWCESTGAQTERRFAADLDMPIFYSVGEAVHSWRLHDTPLSAATETPPAPLPDEAASS